MESLRFGKHPPLRDYRTLLLKNYLTPQLPPPPQEYDALKRVYESLDNDKPETLFPMDGNDTLGDCTLAALAHAETVYNGLVGRKSIMAKGEVTKVYLHLTHGIDSGLAELDVLNYWQSTGAGGEKILAFAAVNKKDHTHVRQAIRLFGGVYLGFQVQANCVRDFNARKPWTPGQLLPEGHAVFATSYDEEGVTVLTWGNTQRATWSWWDECVDEAYAILPPESEEPHYTPGFDFAALKKDLQAVAN